MDSDLSQKMHQYLAQIHRLADLRASADGFVSTSSLAECLHVSAPAVNRMINKLKEMGLLNHTPYQGIQLTASGQQQALKHIRAHRIAEVFLVEVMGFTWEVVYEEATRLSSALDELLINRMYEMAGSPTQCPHGEMIPDAEGMMPLRDDVLLSDADEKTRIKITRILTREIERLQYIEALGLMPGTEIEILHIAPFNGPMQLKVGKEYRIIGNNLAQLIRAQQL